MKATMLLDGGKPKVPPEELRKAIQESGLDVSDGVADFGIVVGGDGRFGRYGRTEDMPLLFVGVRSKGAAGSKAHLAETTFERLPWALRKIRDGKYEIDEHRRLDVMRNGTKVGEAFTDVYLQRGNESACIRYKVRITGRGVDIDEAAIGDGVVVTTQAGATGYYSYLDRIKGDWMDPNGYAKIGRREVGICHVNPTFSERAGLARKHPLRYTVPWGSRIELSLFRDADARLYGTTDDRAGVRVTVADLISIVSSHKVTKVIKVKG